VQKPTLPFSRATEPDVPGAPLLFAGRYETESRLGIGGMAEVLLARDNALGRRVALKLLAPQLAADPVFVERFRREATAIASLNHPNVIVIYDHGVADGQPFIAMEYVPGSTLKELITAGAPFSAAAAVRYASQVLDGLAAAHAVGIVHRDVKPQNLIVRDDGTLKVADFGVARSADETVLTQHGSVIGTADYISPEQARGAPAGAASDLYSVGVVLFEMLTGRVPFTGELPIAIANQHVGTPPPPIRELNPAVPPLLARVVDRALSKQPAGRYGSAAEMKAALTAPAAEPTPTMVAPAAHVPAGGPTQVMPPPPTEVLPAPTRLAPVPGRRLTRRQGLAALGAAVVLGGGAVLVLVAGGGDGARPLVPVPKVVGTPVGAARSALLEDGFDVRVGAKRHSGRPAGTVAGVRPAAPSAERGALITLIPSSGPALVVIPQLTGFTQAAATAELERRGLVVQPATAYSSAPAGSAIGTAPAAGNAVSPHSAVSLTISAGPEPVVPAKPVPAGHAKDERKPGKGHKKPKRKG
jgi:eukaryotic-like serine/threonine-protein kinase